jgi:GNAT superfamily N-acetyltransferase
MRIGSYLESQILLFPRTVIFTAVVAHHADNDHGDNAHAAVPAPTQPASSPSPDTEQQQQPLEVLVGTAEVSFDRSTHSTRLTLRPPTRCAYVTNMAVAPAWRRQGVGRQLLQALEQASCVQARIFCSGHSVNADLDTGIHQHTALCCRPNHSNPYSSLVHVHAVLRYCGRDRHVSALKGTGRACGWAVCGLRLAGGGTRRLAGSPVGTGSDAADAQAASASIRVWDRNRWWAVKPVLVLLHVRTAFQLLIARAIPLDPGMPCCCMMTRTTSSWYL